MKFKLRSIVLLVCLVRLAFSQNFTSRAFSTDQGLPDTYIYSVLQDKDGFLWIATGKGLVKFDGQVFQRYNLHANEQDDIIYSGSEDKNKDLWFGTFSGKIYKLDRVRNRLKLYPKSIGGSVNKIIASAYSNRIYFFSKGSGIYYLEKNRLEQITESQNYQINALEEMDENNLLLATSEGLLRLDVLKNEAIKLKGFDKEVKDLQSLRKKKGFMLYVPGSGMIEIGMKDRDDFSVLRVIDYVAKNFPEGIGAFYFNEENNDLYFGTQAERFVCLNLESNKIKLIDESEFQANISSIFVDKEFNIWVSTTGKGLYRFFRTEFDLISLNNEAVFAITQDSSGITYYGTRKGIVLTNPQGEFMKRIELLGTTELGKINALYCDTRNKLWIGTDDKGLFLLDLLTQKLIPLEFSGIPNISVNAVNGRDETKEVQVCTNLEGVYNYVNYQLKNHFSVQNSLLHNNVYYSQKSKNGKIYYATHNTSFNFSQQDQIYEIDIKDNGLISDFNSFAESPDGTLMIGTNGEGIYKLTDTMIRPLPFNSRFETRFCKGLMYDRDGNLWIMMGKNLYKYYSKDGILKEIEVGANNAAVFNANAFYINKRGDLYFGTTNYVIFYNHHNSKLNTKLLPRSYLLQLSINDSTTDLSKPVELVYGKYNFKFNFSALSLKNSEEVSFKYMLEGRDENWSDVSRSRRVEYSNLPDGSYTFKVMAINSEGFSEEQASTFTFIIKKPFWKSMWFWVAVGFFLVFGLVFIIRIRTASLRKAKIKLELIVQEKTRELREEKELVEKNTKIIEEQNQEIKDSITYAKRIQDALLPDINALNKKAEGLFVFYQPRDIVSGDFYWVGEVNGVQVIVAADCTGHGVPGAFMSMIGNTLLNKIVLERKITGAKAILTELDKEVKNSLKQHSHEATKDGMDLALCCIDRAGKKVVYAAALRPLYHVREGELTEYAPTKLPIGGFNYGESKVFGETEIQLQHNDMLYIFSDGYADQFGGERGKKFMLKNFKVLLSSIAHLELNAQEEALRKSYNGWKGRLDQVDDALVVGIRL